MSLGHSLDNRSDNLLDNRRIDSSNDMPKNMLDSLISPGEIPFEEKLLENSENETLWLEYFEAYANDIEKAKFILDRAVSELPHSVLLWNAYLLLPWSQRDKRSLLGLYKRALISLHSTPAFWFRYIELMSDPNSNSDKRHLKEALDLALFNLDRSQHGQIWHKYLDLAGELNNMESAAIYARYFEISSEISEGFPSVSSEQCVLKVAEFGDFRRAIELFQSLQNTKPARSRSFAEFTLEFLQVLATYPKFKADSYVEQTAQSAMKDFPEYAKRFLLVLAGYFSARDNLEKTRYFHTLASEQSRTVEDVVDVYRIMTNWEENQMEKLYSAGDCEELQLRLKFFARLLEYSPLLINDVLIRINPNNVDHWLDRAHIYIEKQDPGEIINTYVAAIRRVNPLKSTSRKGQTLADIWTRYADVYVSQNDLTAANVIYSHAVKSQYNSVGELAEIYIAWTEMIFTVSDEDALKHIEQILFDHSSPEMQSSERKEKSKSVHDQIQCSVQLWEFYIDMLKSMIEDDGDNSIVIKKLDSAYSQMSKLQIISLRSLLEYAQFSEAHSNTKKCYSIYEAGIQSFRSPQAQFHIWTVYLDKLMEAKEDGHVIRASFDKCLSSEISGFMAYEIFEKYIGFEHKKGNLVRSVKIMRDAIEYLTRSYEFPSYTRENRNKIADDKFMLFVRLSRTIKESLHDKQLYRDVMTEALQDPHSTLPNILELGLDFIDFEKHENEDARVRALFKHLAVLGHPESHVMKNVWEKWQEWEVENGTESSYKQMLKSRRQVANEFREISQTKAGINPMGFVVGQSRDAPVELEPATAVNPDAIELDMDM